MNFSKILEMEITKRKYFLLSLFLSFSIASFVQFRAIFDDTAVNSGVRNQIYWMARLVDPSLFPNDIIADHFAQPKMISPILSFIYGFLPKNIEPSDVTQFIPLVLVLVSTIFLFKAAELRFDIIYTFWLCFGFNVGIWMIDNLAGGLQRAFFYPLFFLFLWILAKKSRVGIILCLLLEAFIYPISFIISLVVLVLCLVFQSLCVLDGDLKLRSSSNSGSQVFIEKLVPVSLLGAVLGFCVIYIRYLYFTDSLVSGYLHEEFILKQYLSYIAPLLAVIIVTRFIYDFERGIRNLRLVLVILVLFMSFSFWRDNLIKIDKDEYKIYKFFKTTAKDTLIVAPINIADNIPIFSYRSVLVNSVMDVTKKNRYSSLIEERIKDLDEIYSATTLNALKILVKKYGIKFLVLELKKGDSGAEQVMNGNPVLQNLLLSKRLCFKTENYAVIKF